MTVEALFRGQARTAGPRQKARIDTGAVRAPQPDRRETCFRARPLAGDL